MGQVHGGALGVETRRWRAAEDVDFTRVPLTRPPLARAAAVLAGCGIVHCGGIHVLTPVLGMVLALILIGVLLAKSQPAARPGTTCVVAAVLLATTGTWSSLAWSFERAPLSPPQQLTHWRRAHAVSDAHFPTFEVAGWPLQSVEGHGGGGAPEKLLWGKGLGVMHANFLIWLALSGVVTWLLGRRVAPWICGLGFLVAPMAVGVGVHRLLLMLD